MDQVVVIIPVLAIAGLACLIFLLGTLYYWLRYIRPALVIKRRTKTSYQEHTK